MTEIRVGLPVHLRRLADTPPVVVLSLAEDQPATVDAALTALETRYPVLRGAIRDPVTGKRRPFVRFFACEQDFSHEPASTPLPEAVLAAREPFLVVGAMAGG